MKRYVINYTFDEHDSRYVAVCPQFFGFIAYYDTFEQLKKGCLKLLKIYVGKEDVSGVDVVFVEKSLEFGTLV